MGSMNDDDERVTRPAPTTPVRSDSLQGPDAAGERGGTGDGGDPGDPGDNDSVEEGPGPGMPGIEEAGYGYGV